MPRTLLSASHISNRLVTTKLSDIGTIIISFSQMRKLRYLDNCPRGTNQKTLECL